MRADTGALMNMPAATILGVEDLTLSRDEAAFLRAADPWGLILFARNIADSAQLARLTGDLRDCLGRDAPILIDQEGGRVQRLGPPLWRQWLPPLEQMARTRPGHEARAVWIRHRLIAAELANLGINVDCAPCCDIAAPETHPFLKNRCFGEDAATVILAARAAAGGLMAGGVLPVIKHVPGHGRAVVDSHVDLPHINLGLEALRAADFAPFRALADLPLAMTGHLVVSAIDPARPATESPAVIALVRDELGFDGLLMSDDIGMAALSGSLADRAGRAMAAGCDVTMHCNGTRAEFEVTVASSGHLSAEGARRAAQAMDRCRPPEAIDERALLTELDDLLN